MKKLLVGLTAASALLGACGQEEEAALPPPANPRAALLDATTAAYEAGTMHEEFTVAFAAAGQHLSFSGEADVDVEHQRASITMDLGVAGGHMDMIMDGGVVYMRAPMFSDVGTEWVSIDAAKVDPVTASQLGGMGTGSIDPSAYAALFAGAVHVAERGSQEIGGVTTTHYVGTIDLAKAIEGFSDVLGDQEDPATAAQLEQALGQLRAIGLGTMPFEAWIDGDGLLRRERFTMDFGEMFPGLEDASMDMTVDFSAFGEPVEIDVPAPSEVTDVTAMVSGQGSASGGYG